LTANFIACADIALETDRQTNQQAIVSETKNAFIKKFPLITHFDQFCH
jgi:hypothetical protein